MHVRIQNILGCHLNLFHRMFLLLLNFTMMHMVIYGSEDNFHKTGPDKAPILNLSTWKYSYP